LEKVWGPHPIPNVIVEILHRKGAMTDVDLHEELKNVYGDVSFREVNAILMKLEVSGVVRVSRLLKKKRRVELVAASPAS
jgi:transcription initiation factor IIE alpha subunit